MRILAIFVVCLIFACNQIPQDNNGSRQRTVSEIEVEENSSTAELASGEAANIETLSAKIAVKAGSFKSAVKVSLQEVNAPSAAKSFTALSKAQAIKVTDSSGTRVKEVTLPLEVSLKDLSTSGKDMWILIVESDGTKGLVKKPKVSNSNVSFLMSSTDFTAVAIEAQSTIPSGIDFLVDENGKKIPLTTSTPDTVAAATPTPTAAPIPVAPATGTATQGNTQNNLTWTAVAGAASYKIFFKTSSGVTSSDSFVTSTTNSKTHTGLTNGTTYYYKVAAIDAAGTVGTLSPEFSAMPAGPPDHFIFVTSNTYPTTVSAGSNIAASNTIAVQLVDVAGYLSHNGSVTAYLLAFSDSSCTTLASGAKGGTWSGTLTSAAKTFSSFNYERAEAIYLGVCDTSNCSGGTLTKACRSTAVSVSPAGASSLAFGTLASPKAGDTFTHTVEVVDAYGNRDTSDSSTQITIAACSTSATDSNCPAANSTLSGTLTRTVSSGLATFTGLSYATAEDIKFRATTAGGFQKASATASFRSPSIGALSAGYAHACAINKAGYLFCWGNNGSGRLGDATTTERRTPTAVNGGGTWKMIATGGAHTCAIKSDDTLRCWGSNTSGQLGDNSTSTRTTPTAISGGGNWKAVAAGGYHTCAIKSDDTLHCWGENDNGRLGDNSQTDRSVPTAVSGGATYKAVSAGLAHTCAIKTDNSLECWGYGGRVGDNTATNRLVPAAVNGGGTWIDISAGMYHSCGIKTDNSLHCWGTNPAGQIGDNSISDRNAPTAVSGGGLWRLVGAGANHSCGVKSDGSLHCWGKNNRGENGDNSTTETHIPTAVSGGGTWEVVVTGGYDDSAGYGLTCGVSGALKCWGHNGNGQVGDTTTTQRNTPTILPDYRPCLGNQPAAWSVSFPGATPYGCGGICNTFASGISTIYNNPSSGDWSNSGATCDGTYGYGVTVSFTSGPGGSVSVPQAYSPTPRLETTYTSTTWKCCDTNTLTRIQAGNACQNWPDTITVTPSGSCG